MTQYPVEIRSVFNHGLRLIEKLFGGDGEEFSFIDGAIGIEKTFPAAFDFPAQAEEFARTYPHPFTVFGTAAQRGRAVGRAVEHVQLVGEFMVDYVVAPFRMAAAA